MKVADVIAGLQVLEKYADYVCADHDIIYGAPPGIDVSPDDAEKLESLGWFIDGEYHCWAAFV